MPGKNKQKPQRSAAWDHAGLIDLIGELKTIRQELLDLEGACKQRISTAHPSYQASGCNLLHYLALRRRDIRPLQAKLSALSLSSLGRAEGHVLASINALLQVACKLADLPPDEPPPVAVSFVEGGQFLQQHTDELLGPSLGHRDVRIMVTMPSEAADDYLLVKELLASGMNCMRINCAHDDAIMWERMVNNLRRARRELGSRCRVLMDLAGPKLRTGPIEPGVSVIKWRPRRDLYGKVVEPARIWLMPEEDSGTPHASADAVLPFPNSQLKELCPGDLLEFTDTRGARRSLEIVGEVSTCRWGESRQTAYVTPGMEMRRLKTRRDGKRSLVDTLKVGAIPPAENFLLLQKGDLLVLTRAQVPGCRARYDGRGKVQSPARIACTLPEVFADVRSGERIWLDDGKIGGVIRVAGEDEIQVEITQARPQGEKLRAEKGINLPDSRLRVTALTDKDREDLPFIVKHAHMVGMSFAQHVDDVLTLQKMLRKHGGQNLGIVLKIETRRGFEMLPDLLFAAMCWQKAGVMIARGDLAVESGYERLAEVQEEILWLCEAAHMPVIWATQVLETLAKSGLPSRAEITDAAMGGRAECVMLNKGPHIVEAIRVLDNILLRMAAHQSKKSALLRQLHWWELASAHCGLPNSHVPQPEDDLADC